MERMAAGGDIGGRFRRGTWGLRNLESPEKRAVTGPSRRWPQGLLFLAVVLFLPWAVSAQNLREDQRWIEQVDGGFVLPVSRANGAAYGVGVGGDILVGYRFDRDLSLSGDLGYYDCDQKSAGAVQGEWLYTPLMAVARLNFGSSKVRPFILFGAGIAFNTFSVTPASTGIKVSEKETDLLVSPGAGVLFVIGDNTALYLQGRLDLNFTAARASGSPFTDSPSLFLPVKAGMSFFVL